MMTFREMLNVVFNTGTVFKVMSKIEQIYYENTPDQLDMIMKKYTSAAQEMLDIPGLPGCEQYMIRLSNVTDPDEDNYVDVHLYNEKTDEVYSVSYTDWSEVVDLPVTVTTHFDMVDQVAHILWELTFHGFTRAEVNGSRAELIAAMDEVKNGDATLVSWDELKSELKNLK